jgi:hypothetical protein
MAIPKTIYQTISNRDDLHPAFIENIERLRALDSGWNYQLFDETERLAFIECHYDRGPVEAYNKIDPIYGPARHLQPASSIS